MGVDNQAPPPFPLPPAAGVMRRPTASAWREEALARALEMLTLLQWLEGKSPLKNKEPLIKAVQAHLDAAEQAANERRRAFWGTMSGAVIVRTSANLDAAIINLLRLAPLDYLSSNASNLLMQARQQLRDRDPRLQQLEVLARKAERNKLTHSERNVLIAAVQGAAEQERRAQMRVRGFRNIIVFTATLLFLLAAAAAFIGFISPDLLPLCFQPQQQVVCPTSEATISEAQATNAAAVNDAIRQTASMWDTMLVEFVGLLGATIAAAAALSRSRGTADPYSLPVALALLKVSTGMLTSFLGILLIRAQFIPGLTALDSSAQIVAWAIVLGYAQQVFTRAVDRQAQTVLAESDYAQSRRPEPTEEQLSMQDGQARTTPTTASTVSRAGGRDEQADS